MSTTEITLDDVSIIEEIEAQVTKAKKTKAKKTKAEKTEGKARAFNGRKYNYAGKVLAPVHKGKAGYLTEIGGKEVLFVRREYNSSKNWQVVEDRGDDFKVEDAPSGWSLKDLVTGLVNLFEG